MEKALFQRSEPATAIRGVHLDLKGVPPTFSRLMELVSLFAKLRFNAVLLEWEDTFPWKCDERFRGRGFYSPDEVRKFAESCERHGLEIIPLVQSLGHAENVLKTPGYEELREVPHRTDVFHPLHPRSPEVVCEMVGDVLELLPDIRRFHLGGDEAYTLGEHPASAAFVAEHGKARLYLRQLESPIALLEDRGIRPLLWHDEFVGWPDEDLSAMAARIDLMVWGYSGDPADVGTYHNRLPHAVKLHGCGFPLWAATSYKGAEGASANRPDPIRRERTTLGWMKLRERFQWQGVIATAWSRYGSGRLQTTPIDAALDALVHAAVLLHDAAPPTGGLAACEAWLDAIGAGEDFRRCKATMEELTRHVDKAWEWIRHLEEQAANLTVAPERANSGIEQILLDLLFGELRELRAMVPEVEQCLEGKVMPPFPAHYAQERIRAIETCAERLRGQLGPDGVRDCR